MPILLTHGYPDSFVRFLKLIPLLTAEDADGFSFDVVVPSIPGYGFSDGEPELLADDLCAFFKPLWNRPTPNS